MEVDIITPEFEIDVRPIDGGRTRYRVIDIPNAKIIFEKVLNIPYVDVMDILRQKLKEVVE